MKYLIILTLFGILLFSCSQEEQVDQHLEQESLSLIKEDRAIEIAKNVIFKSDILSKSRNNKIAISKKQIREILPVQDENSKNVFYIINYENNGFIILSADNRISPILAYSDKDEFRTNSESYPSGLVEWLSLTKNSIKSIREKNNQQSIEMKQEWESFSTQRLVEPDDPNDCDNEFEQVGPLLSTTWNQRCGFNDFMPTMSCNVPCGHAYAGCVPVAIAQVMRFHEYPTNYNWSNMPNNSGSTTTASLINDIHNAITVNIFGNEYPAVSYSCDGTGVDKDYNTAGVFTNKFGYSTANQGAYNSETVKQQLRWKRPVILGGGRNDGWWIFNDYTDGHMWVCDGFRRTKSCMFDDYGNLIGAVGYLYFHMNWGWGGNENGWYAFNNFNPGNNTFNYQVKMVYNIKP